MRHRVATGLVIVALASGLAVAPAISASADLPAPSTIVLPTPEPTLPEEPQPTDPPDPGPTDPPPVPTTPPVDPTPAPTEAPPPEVPVEEPAEPEVPVEVPVEEPSFVDGDDDSDVEEEEVAPLAPEPSETPSPTPTVTPTPIPAVDIFAPFYPPSSGAARDLLPLTLGGIAAGLVVVAAIVAFIVSRWKLARLRSSLILTERPVDTTAHADRRLPHKTPSALDISSLVGARSSSTRQPPKPSLSLHLPERPRITASESGAQRFQVPAAPTSRRASAAGSRRTFDLAAVFGGKRRAAPEPVLVSRDGLEGALGAGHDRAEIPKLDLDWRTSNQAAKSNPALKLDFPTTPARA
jgi:hypothetical protein